MFRRLFLLCAIVLILAGCGANYGGSTTGGGGGGTSYTGQAQGVYSGTSSNGYTFITILLPNDKFYAVYGTVSGNSLIVYGMLTGQGTSGNGTYTANVNDFFYTGAVSSGSVNATFVPGSSVSGSITEGGSSYSFSATALSTPAFNYNTAASIGTISGMWSGNLLDGVSTTLTINSNGTVSGSSSGCSFTGTATPDSSNKNFFNVSLTFGGAPCAFPNQTASGVAVSFLLSDGVTRDLVAGVNLGTTIGTVFFAQR